MAYDFYMDAMLLPVAPSKLTISIDNKNKTLVLINDEGLRTIPLGLAYLKSTYVSNVVLIAASTILSALPSIGIYVVLQRQFIEGIAQGSIK